MSTTTEKLSSPVKADDLAQHLRKRIESGEIPPGDRLPTFSEMRREYGAATNTVDRAYSQLEADGLIERKAGSGVYVSEHPGTTSTGTIGCLGAGFSGNDIYWNHCIRGINRVLESHGMHPLLLPRLPNAAAWNKVDGVLCHDADRLPEGCPESLPRVSMLHRMSGTVSVIADDYDGARLATNHLLQLGHTRIGSLFIQDDPLGIVRLSGYETALRRADIQPSPEWSRDCEGNLDKYSFSEVARRVMAQWLSGNWADEGLTALVAQNDHVAIGAMEALEEAGLNVPGDVSVVGFDGTTISEHCRPRLTTIKVPLQMIGERATEELINQIARTHEKREETIVLPVKLVERDSTTPPGERR